MRHSGAVAAPALAAPETSAQPPEQTNHPALLSSTRSRNSTQCDTWPRNCIKDFSCSLIHLFSGGLHSFFLYTDPLSTHWRKARVFKCQGPVKLHCGISRKVTKICASLPQKYGKWSENTECVACCLEPMLHILTRYTFCAWTSQTSSCAASIKRLCPS